MGVGALERKMVIHAQPTCLMNYDGATGWLVGQPGRGLNAMFTMMNAERLFVGIQGLGIAEAANQKAVAYAKERLQRSEEHTSELQSLMRISYAVFCLKKKNKKNNKKDRERTENKKHKRQTEVQRRKRV